MPSKEKPSKKKNLWASKDQHVMLASIIVGVIICAILFSVLGVYLSKNTRNTADNLGNAYMENMGFQIDQRFEAVIEQRFAMVQGIVNYSVKSQIDHGSDYPYEVIKEQLKSSAEARDFEFLALYRVNEEFISDAEKGRTINVIMGKQLDVTDKPPFRNSVLKREKKVAVGEATNDEGVYDPNMVIISIPTDDFVMQDGRKCHALIAGVSNQAFVQMLNINGGKADKNSAAYIIRRNQTIIMTQDRTDGDDIVAAKYKNKPLKEMFEVVLNGVDVSVDSIVSGLADKMKDGETYAQTLHVDRNGKQHHVHLYASSLGDIDKLGWNSEWYLVVLMNNENINGIIEDMSEQWVIIIVIAIICLIVLLTVIFLLYSRFNKRSMEQLEQARQEAIHANKAKSEFLSNMSHDIRTPMNAIVGMTAIARANLGNEQQVGDCLKKIALSSKHLLGLINDVLDMSKIESGKMTFNMEQVSLREVLDGITTIVQPQIKIKRQNFNVIVRHIEQENVYCDSVRLNQVMLNLLSNAIKFTAEEGTIEIYLDQEASPLGDDYVRTHIRVKDNGIGMSEEYQKKIFESFSREDSKRVHHTEGSGLGMAITKYIVDAMRGTIDLKSELNMGTQFHITLDLEKATVPEEDMILPNWKMLIVDDDQQLCETTVVALKEIGVDSEWTLDGESAVEKTVKAHDAHKPYDIILLDWKLPGIDGLETARRMRKRLNDDVPILLISAYDWSEIETEARAAGISGFISKPLFKSTLFYGLKSFAGDDAVPEKPVLNEQPRVDLKGIRVLLAEDNELNWEIAEALLDSVGIVCDHAENGQICVDMFNSSVPGTYKAILMDIRMPLMNGYEATEEIRKSNHPDKDLPIIAMTADAFSDDMRKCLECGMNAHIAKPIDIDTVQKTIAKFIKK